MKTPTVTVSTPGRICLFGEHQDYLRLPVIAAAISLRLTIAAAATAEHAVQISLPDIDDLETMTFAGGQRYQRERDYFRSGINVMRRHGFTFKGGAKCEVRGNIPINAGTSSSTAMTVSWMHLLAALSDQRTLLPPLRCAQLSHEAEVVEFGEPGGMMDQYSTSMGGTLFIEFSPAVKLTRMTLPSMPIVIGNSREPKDTKAILSRVKTGLFSVTKRLGLKGGTKGANPLASLTPDAVKRFERRLTKDEYALLLATVENHGMTLQAAKELQRDNADIARIGRLMNKHQDNLRDILRISTPKIDGMIDAALAAGAIGAKINGSGGGGCMFALAPVKPEAVAAAITNAGGEAHTVRVDSGTRIEHGIMI